MATVYDSLYANKRLGLIIFTTHVLGSGILDGTMPQAGIDPLAQSHASYEASALPPSHHSWIWLWLKRTITQAPFWFRTIQMLYRKLRLVQWQSTSKLCNCSFQYAKMKNFQKSRSWIDYFI